MSGGAQAYPEPPVRTPMLSRHDFGLKGANK